MTLATSGTMSIGGSTQDRSINLELKRAATATSNLNETSLRDLADVSSGAISLSDFYGKSYYDWSVTITIGAGTFFGQYFRGYGSVGDPSNPSTFGSASDTTCDLYSTNPTWAFYSVNNGMTFFYVYDSSGTPTGNAGWTTCDVYITQQNTNGTPSTTRTRSNLTYSQVGSTRFWNMADGGQTNGQFTFPSNVWVSLGFR